MHPCRKDHSFLNSRTIPIATQVQEMSVRRSRKLCTRAIISWSWSLQCRRRACAILETVADFSTTGDAFAAWREMVLGGGSVLHGEGDYDEMLRPASSSGSQVRGILRRTQLSSREGDTRGGWNGEDDEVPAPPCCTMACTPRSCMPVISIL